MDKLNKWKNGAIPALLIHVCIGSVYCWSLIKDKAADALGTSTSSIEIAFSLAIFFLGMSAAFFGRMVELNVQKSAKIATFFFTSGLGLCALSLNVGSTTLFILAYGAIMGIGLGVGYLTPVKTLMLWFKENQGLAAGIAIAGFGLSKVIFSPFIEFVLSRYSISTLFIIMMIIGFVCLFLASVLISKPKGWEEDKKIKHGYFKLMCENKELWKIWFVFFLNITCGLAIISFEKNICSAYEVALAVGIVSAISAVFNTLGRIGFATWSDYLSNKTVTYLTFLTVCIVICLLGGLQVAGVVLILLWLVNLGYGGGFSSLPPLLVSKFGVKRLSVIHGLTLSAWGVAGLCGNSLSDFVINTMNLGYDTLFLILAGLYLVALVVTLTIKKSSADDISEELEKK